MPEEKEFFSQLLFSSTKSNQQEKLIVKANFITPHLQIKVDSEVPHGNE